MLELLKLQMMQRMQDQQAEAEDRRLQQQQMFQQQQMMMLIIDNSVSRGQSSVMNMLSRNLSIANSTQVS